jgi:hypothetical protein
MSKLSSVYQVVQAGKIVACGNLPQCWLYLANAYGKDMTVEEMAERETFIEPAKGRVA